MHTSTSMIRTEEISSTQICEPGNGNLAALVEGLRCEVVQGFLDSHIRSNKNAGKSLEIASFCYALIELLKEKGIISFDELDDRQKVVNKRLVKKFEEQGMGVVALQEFKQDKYKYKEEVKIDCENRIHICNAACCRFDLALSKQDIEEGIVKWELGKPYLIARNADGYCRHYDRTTSRCSVWQHRPIPCRGYDCRKDGRIWIDFEKAIINPDLEDLFSQRDEMTK
ncbi:MAG: YkgJ family cysteine cluster protein [bacterium]